MGPETLAQVLRPMQGMFPADKYPDLLVGLDISDDAAVYKVSDEKAIIHTLDFFTPVVDDPYDFGSIAAANAMSDVYAMGGEVVMALNICGFPTNFPVEIISDILQGGAEKVVEAGGVLAGGHTIGDKEPKYGLSVMGTVHPKHILTKVGAHPKDILILTKPLGVGVITTALKGEKAEPDHVAKATESMKKLNRLAAQIIQEVGVNACTDVTGFSLLGHACEMAEKSKVGLRFQLDKLPFLDGADKYASQGIFPGGACRNRDCYKPQVNFTSGIGEKMQMLLFTPETSGGLLVAVLPEKVEQLIGQFVKENQSAWVVGEVVEGRGIEVVK
jgi:selenide,water dikinase